MSPSLTAPAVVIFGFDVTAEVVMLGAITGLTYGLLAMGLTLVYRTSRTVNFAHGEMGALPAIIIPVLVLGHGLTYWLALPTAIVAAVAAGALTEFLVIRRLRHAPRLIVLVATLGVAQILFFSNLVIPREGALAGGVYPTPFDWRLTVGSFDLTPGHLLILFVAPLAAVGVSLFLSRTTLGMASRAAAENRDAAELTGVSVGKVTLVVWSLAGLLAGISAILVGPTQPLTAQAALGPTLMVRGLAAALIGGLSNFGIVFAAGIGLGVIERMVLWNFPTGGVVEFLFLGVVVVSLLVHRGLRQAARDGGQATWSLAGALRTLNTDLRAHPRVALARRVGTGALLVFAFVLPLLLQSGGRVLMSSVLLFAIMGLSLVVLIGMAGQVSLGQFTFVGLGAVVGARVIALGYPPWISMLYAVGAAGLAALLVGIPALRVRGLFLAVSTLAFAVAAQRWLFRQGWLIGDSVNMEMARFEWMGIDFQDERNYYWLCLVALVGAVLFVSRLRRTGVGRAMMAVRDNEPTAATLSVPPRRVKLQAFVISGMLAGFAGYLYGGLLVSFDSDIFGPGSSLDLVAMTIFGGVTSITGAILGALWVRGIPFMFGSDIGLLSTGAGLLLVLMVFPGGLASAAFRVRDWVVERLTGRPVDEAASGDRAEGAERPELEPRPEPRPVLVDARDVPVPALRAEDVVVRYGGNTAVDGVSLHAMPGEIVGLIGPNGAGKTSLFDVLSGQLRPDQGRVHLHGVDITRHRAEARARMGLGRSFQQARLFDEMPVIDAFKVALERHEPSELVPSVLGLPPSRVAEAHKDLRAAELVELVGLGPFARRNVSELSTGTRRLAELGCIIALGADVILLDEPMAGIAQREVEAFVPVLREVRDHLDATFVVIDHDIPMITSLVDRLAVLANGRVIAEGPPEVAAADPAVVAAYLGADERAIGRSGDGDGGRGSGGSTTSRESSRRPLVAPTKGER